MKRIFSSQFAYCSLIYMFHSRQINYKINELHERVLRIIYKDHFSPFGELLSKDIFVVIVHQRNLEILATEIYKILNVLSPGIMQDLFEIKSNYYNIRNAPAFSTRVRYGLQTISYIAPKIWNLLLKEMKLLWRSYCSKWIKDQNQDLEVRKLSLTTL